MSTSEQELSKFRRIAEDIHSKPEVPIGTCVGSPFSSSRFGSEHHLFVVKKLDKIIGEFDTLDEALAIPGANPYDSGFLCSSCAELGIK